MQMILRTWSRCELLRIITVALAICILPGKSANSQSLRSEVCQPGTLLGIVEDLHGTWDDLKHLRKTGSGLAPMNLVCTDSLVLREGQGSPSDGIQIRLNDGQVRSFSCKIPTLCLGPLPLPKIPEAPSGFLQVVFYLLMREDPPPAPYLSRGTILLDAVVELNANQLNLAPALRYVGHDQYMVQLCRIDLKDVSACSGKKLEQIVNVDGTATKRLATTSLEAGLYELELLDPKTLQPVASSV